jgi:hypothetical protein
MDCSKLNSTLDLLDAKINLLETSLGVSAHERKVHRNGNYADTTKVANAHHYVDEWVVNSGTIENNTAEMLRLVNYVYSAFAQHYRTIRVPHSIGIMIYRNKDKINLFELRDRVSRDRTLYAEHRGDIVKVIDNIIGGNGAEYAPPAPAH